MWVYCSYGDTYGLFSVCMGDGDSRRRLCERNDWCVDVEVFPSSY